MSKVITYVKHCADCGALTEVVDIRTKRNGTVWRKRKCTSCGYTFHTTEIEECALDVTRVIEENERLKKQIELIKQVVNS